jgi:hypothetical protein
MAVKTSTPWWVSALLALGLLFLFAGERVLAHLDTASSVLTWFGLLLIAGSTAIRFWAFRREKDSRRNVERLLLLCHAGVIAALAIYYLFGTEGGQEMVGIDPENAGKASTMALVGWLLVMGLSLIPLLMVELALGLTGRDWFPKAGGDVADEAAVELFRVREMATSGLTIALAAGFLLVTCNVAKERDIREDVSYFKTSRPGPATINMASSFKLPMRVLIFFPEVNEVADEVEAYFRQLNAETGGKVAVERHDRVASPGLAKELKVNVDGTVVLMRGETPEEKEAREKAERETKTKTPDQKPLPASEKLTLPVDFAKARRDKLREFDGEVQKALMKVLRAKRVAYFSVGHGELNDPKSAGVRDLVDPGARSANFKQILQILNYEVKDWEGFGKPVPDDATLLVVLGPRQPLIDEDLNSIAEYLDGGGALFIALDPKSEATLGVLEGRLGVKFDRTPITDDKNFFIARRNPSDHRFAVTNQFSSHASVTTLARAGVKAGIPLLEAGNLVDADFMVEEGVTPPQRSYVIRSMTTSFTDKPGPTSPQGNYAYDKGSEERRRYNVAAAVEGVDRSEDKDEDKKDAKPEAKDKARKGSDMRAMVFADVDIFEDRALASFAPLQFVVRDAALWLGGEEELAGETIDEKDTVIEHTKSEDVVWFYLSLVGAPVVILGFGLGGVMWRRRRAQRRRS